MDLLKLARHNAGLSVISDFIVWGGISAGIVFLSLFAAVYLFRPSEKVVLAWLIIALALMIGSYVVAGIAYFTARRDPVKVRKELEEAASFARERLEKIEPELASISARLEKFEDETSQIIFEAFRRKLIPALPTLEEQLEWLKGADGRATREMRLKNGQLFRDIARHIREHEALLAELESAPELQPPPELARLVIEQTKESLTALRWSIERLRDILTQDVQEARTMLAEAERLLSLDSY